MQCAGSKVTKMCFFDAACTQLAQASLRAAAQARTQMASLLVSLLRVPA
jgi:hypothetical protein